MLPEGCSLCQPNSGRLTGPRLDVASVLPALGTVLGIVRFLLLGMAMPVRWPRRAGVQSALPVPLRRFGVPAAACLVAQAAGARAARRGLGTRAGTVAVRGGVVLSPVRVQP